jgi:hypothetical protein
MSALVQFDVAISYASENEQFAEALARELRTPPALRVHYAPDESGVIAGSHLDPYLTEMYRDRARICVALISKPYARKLWTRFELRAVHARLLIDPGYLIPVMLEELTLPGLDERIVRLRAKNKAAFLAQEVASVAQVVRRKLQLRLLSQARSSLPDVLPGGEQTRFPGNDQRVADDLVRAVEQCRRIPHSRGRADRLPLGMAEKLVRQALRVSGRFDRSPSLREAAFHAFDVWVHFHTFTDTREELEAFLGSNDMPLRAMERLAGQNLHLRGLLAARRGDCGMISAGADTTSLPQARRYLQEAFRASWSPYPAGRSLLLVSSKLSNTQKYVEECRRVIGESRDEADKLGLEYRHVYVHLLDGALEGLCDNFRQSKVQAASRLAKTVSRMVEEYLAVLEARLEGLPPEFLMRALKARLVAVQSRLCDATEERVREDLQRLERTAAAVRNKRLARRAQNLASALRVRISSTDRR